jgi:general secretion pathway protein G
MKRRAFTLIELLIVVAIIAILAAIAIPNFLSAQVRSKIARAESDMRSVSLALEAYYTDYNDYPPEDGYAQLDWAAFRALTSPVPYITAMPVDAFSVGDPANQGLSATGNVGFYQIGTGSIRSNLRRPPERDVYLIASWGPDLKDDVVHMMHFPRTNHAIPYNPTNGITSHGDLFRFSPSTPDQFLENFRQEADPRVWAVVSN